MQLLKCSDLWSISNCVLQILGHDNFFASNIQIKTTRTGPPIHTDASSYFVIGTLERQFADYLGIKQYRTMDYLKLKNLLEKIGVIKNFQPRIFNFKNIIICACCQELIYNVQMKRLSIKTMGRVICYLYSYYAWTVRDYCEDLSKMYKVQNTNYYCFIIQYSWSISYIQYYW